MLFPEVLCCTSEIVVLNTITFVIICLQWLVLDSLLMAMKLGADFNFFGDKKEQSIRRCLADTSGLKTAIEFQSVY